MKQIDVITLFPEMFSALEYGIPGRALKQKLLTLNCFNPRDFTQNKYRQVDDDPYGGGPGMVMTFQPLRDAIRAAKQKAMQQTNTKPNVIYLSPQGRRLDQASVKKLSNNDHLILVSGRYEGIDERLIDAEIDEEWSIGDYVLSGGELAAMVMIDAIIRLLPGALGDEMSALQDSFQDELLDYPQYTRPPEIDGLTVPAVLLQGNHREINRWRLKQALGRTWQRRPDLLTKRTLNELEQTLLNEFIEETNK